MNGSPAQSFTYDGHDKLVSGTAGNETDTYDQNGNQKSVLFNGTTYTRTYDDEDRLTSTAVPNGPTDTFTYNGLGLRVGKTDSTGSCSYVCDGATPGSPVLSDGHAVYTPGLSENKGGASRYYSFDRIGNLWTIDGASKSQLYYEDNVGFGSLDALAGSGSVFGFGGANGCQTDADTGLVLMGHRYYDTRIGRFISQDHAKSGGNWYAYCGNNPTNHTDPSGLSDGLPGSLGAPDQHYGGLGGFLDGGGMSDLSGFWSSENASEQRGYAAYLATGEVMSTYIDPKFTEEQKSAIKDALYAIASTSHGSEIMGAAYYSKNKISITDLYFDPENQFQPGLTYELGKGAIGIDPYILPYVQVQRSDGWESPTILVVIAHELGHALTGIGDTGPNNNDNVIANENPIVTQLGGSSRLYYNVVAVTANPFGLPPGIYGSP